MGSVGVVVVHHGDRALTRRALESIRGLPVVGQVVVVDHGPNRSVEGDDFADLAAAGVVVVGDGTDNPGFATGVARGIEHLGHEPLVLVANPDVVLDPEALAALVGALDGDPKVAAAAPTLVVGDGRAWYAGGRLDRWRGLAVHDGFGLVPPANRGLADVTFLPLAAALLRRSALAEVGGMPEGWFLYWEDVELCRALTEAGWVLRWVPSAMAIHDRGAHGDPLRNLSPVMLELDTRNRLWWIRLRLRGLQRCTAMAWTLPLAVRRGWLVRRSGGGDQRWRALARGLRAGLGRIPPELRDRCATMGS